MKSIVCSPTLQKVLITLLVIVLITVLILPKRLRFVPDELLGQIKPGMTVESVESLLGKPWDANDYIMWGPPHYSLNYSGPRHYGWRWESKRHGLITDAPDGASTPLDSKFQRHYWVSSKPMLLWVESQGGVIVHAWIVPLKKSPHGY